MLWQNLSVLYPWSLLGLGQVSSDWYNTSTSNRDWKDTEKTLDIPVTYLSKSCKCLWYLYEPIKLVVQEHTYNVCFVNLVKS